MKKYRFAAFYLCIFTLSINALAIDWPTKPIQIICPANPGGDSDFNSRALAEFLTEDLGQPVVVVNVSGGGNAVGTQQVHDSAPDGYTVGFGHINFIINRLSGMLDFGFDEFEVVAGVGQGAGDLLVVNKESGWNTLDDLIRAAKASPGQYKLSGNVGANSYIEALMFADVAGIEFNVVTGGDASAKSTELLGGQIDTTVLPYGTALPYLESGDFIALGLFMQERNEKFPEVPTFIEQGLDVYLETTYFFVMPKGTDKAIVEKLRAAVEKVITTRPEYAEMIGKAYSQSPKYFGPDQLIEMYAESEKRIAPFME